MLIKISDKGEYGVSMRTLNCDFQGYSFLASLQQEIRSQDIKKLYVSFPSNIFIEANLSAVLGAIFQPSSKVKLSFEKPWFGFNRIAKLLSRNGFLNSYGNQCRHSKEDTTVEYKVFKEKDLDNFPKYINEDALKIGTFPKMSNPARKKIIENILEIFINSIIHGRTDKVFICGQYYPNLNLLKFTLVDLGITIKRDIENCMNLDLSGVDAINWAVESGNTTRKGNIPGGLGLKILRDFLRINRGSLQIVSYDGFWEENIDDIETRTLPYPFEGTIVTVTFNTNDSNQYKLREEI